MASSDHPTDPTTRPREGQPDPTLRRDEFSARFRERFYDPAFEAHAAAITQLEAVAWDAYEQGRKSPRTHPAGEGFADPGYELSDQWRANHDALAAAQRRQSDPATPSRILLICASPRSEHTCPGEMSKSYRLLTAAQETLAAAVSSR